MWGALIGAGASILGGIIGNKNNKKNQRDQNAYNQAQLDAMNEYNSPRAIRERAEDGGFNPMSFVGPGVGLSPGSFQGAAVQDMMGSSVMTAGLALQDGLEQQSELKAYSSALEQQNADLRKQLDQQILRPDVPGISLRANPNTVPAADTRDDRATIKPPAQGSRSGIVPLKGPGGGPGENPGRYPATVDVSDRVEEPTPLYTGYEHNGEVLYLPEGPDADELASGLALAKLLGQKRRRARDDWFTREFWKFDPNKRDGYYRSGPYSGG